MKDYEIEKKLKEIRDEVQTVNLTELARTVQRGPPNEVLATNNMDMTRSDFRSLTGSNCLNDKIIDEYLLLIKQRNEREESLPDIEVLTVFLYFKLDTFGLTEGLNQTENWVKDDLRKKESVLVSIHKRDHWSLVHIDIPAKTVYYLDSIVGSRKSSSAPGMMKKYMEEYYRRKGEEVKFKVKVREDIPLQRNGVDCGVFVCQYAERIARRAPMSFKQADMPKTRCKMLREIFQGKIGTTEP